MSREYKFRAWDKKKNIFVPQGEIVFSDYGDTKVVVVPNCIEYIKDSCHEYEDSNRFEIGQFTGLKDINNIEIYEGDYMLDSHSGCWGEVKFYKGAFVVEFDNEIQDLYDWTCECVIGNIYENPELLEYR